MAIKLDLFKPKTLTTDEQQIALQIKKRRLQLLVHSCLYYSMNCSLISDHVFDQWSRELVELQQSYPTISKQVELYESFKDFDGSSGYSLPYYHPNITTIARRLVRYKNGKHEKI